MDNLPPVKEKPVDAFSGIDVLISTPESLEDVRQRLNDAKQKEVELAEKMNDAQMALALAQKAFDEVKVQLETARDEVKMMEANVDSRHAPRALKAMQDAMRESPSHMLSDLIKGFSERYGL